MRTLEEIYYANYQPSAKYFDLRLLAPVRAQTHSPVCEIQLAGISHCGDHFNFVRSGAGTFCVLLCVFAGRGTYDTPVGSWTPEAGDVMIIHPGSRSHYVSSRESPWTLGWFNVCGSLMENLLISYQLGDCWMVEGCHLEKEFMAALEELRENGSDPDLQAQLMLRLVQKIAAARRGTPVPASPAAVKLLDFANRKFTGDITIDELSQISGLSRSQVIRIFRRETGLTPHQYILERRLLFAASLLHSSAKSVKEIAFSTGFSCEFHFSAMFKHRFGTSPTAFRRARRGLIAPPPDVSR